jgi:hypothetical protein
MKLGGPWLTEDYEEMSWHDVHVHGLRFENFVPDNGSCDIILDIDFILKWENAGQGFLFTVCPADLRFHDVFGLKLTLDYAEPIAGMCPFSLDRIDREEVTFPTGHKAYQWQLAINWPRGHIEFQAPGFTQTLTGSSHMSSSQSLTPEERRRVAA